jgi:PAS domain S-box-containing protein
LNVIASSLTASSIKLSPQSSTTDEVDRAYRSVAADLTESVCRLRPDGTFLFVNDAFCRIFGKQRRDLIGRKWQMVALPEDVPLVETRLCELSPERPVVVIENRVIDSSGAVRWMQFTNRAVYGPQGGLLEIQSVGRDITPQVSAELDLDDTRERWFQALEGSGLGVWDWNLEQDTLFFSDEWRRILGYRKDQAIDGGQMGWQNLVHPDDLPDALQAVRQHLEGLTEGYSAEFRMRCSDGSWKWVHARGRVMRRDATGRACRMVGTTADISRRKAVEESERRHVEMVAAGAPAAEVLAAIVRSLETTQSGLRGSVMLVEPSRVSMCLVAAPSLPESLRKSLDGLPVGEGGGCCGLAVQRGRRVICVDTLQTDYMIPFHKPILKHRLLSCWSEPILSSVGQVLGTFACYRSHTGEPQRAELEATARAARLAAVALEREQREKALALSEQRYARAIEGTADGVWDWSVVTNELYLSPSWKALLGFEEHEFVSSREAVRARMHPEDIEMVDAALRDHIENRTPYELEVRLQVKDGSYRWFLARANSERDSAGNPVRLTGTLKDIDARKDAQIKYQREFAYNQALLDNAAAFIAALDTEGRFLHANRSSQEIMGYTEAEMVGRTPWEVGLLEAAEVPRSQERFARLLRGETVPPVDVRVKAKSGEWRMVELRSAATWKPDHTPDRIVITGVDLTERNRLQQEVLKIADKEQARLGHDLHDGVGQTMTGLVIMAEALEAELSGESKELAGRILELLRQSVGEVRRMSHGMSPTSVRYRGLVGALQLLAETVEKNFRTPCSAELDPTVIVHDEERQTHLFRIAQEAVNNALRHGRPKQIRIALTRLSASEGELRISDDGGGMKKSKKNHPGIGMRVMQYRAELISASIEVEGKPRRGVQVVCKFPLEIESPTQLPE